MTARPTILAALALAALVPAAADAATARIAPPRIAHSLVYMDGVVVAHTADACRMLVDPIILDASPGAPILPVWQGKRFVVNACQTIYEDGSALGRVDGTFPRAMFRPGRRYFLGLQVWSRPRAGGSGWSSHRFYRSIWIPRG